MGVPSPRSSTGRGSSALGRDDKLRTDPEFADRFERHEALVLVPFEPPSKSVRVNITLDEAMLRVIDRAAEATGRTRGSFLADAARAWLASRS